jgi:hypothetical protein
MYHVDMATAKLTRPNTTNTSQPAPKAKVFQVLVRLPEDMAARFVQHVRPGQRNSYFLELLRRDLDRESNALEQAAQELTALETKSKALDKEDAAWLNASLSDSDDDFDAAEFERQYQAAKLVRESANQAPRRSTAKGASPKPRRAGPRSRPSLPSA